MRKILLSSCLVGIPVRYDGRTKAACIATIDRWRSEGRLVHICPELAAGFPVPRPPAEIVGGDGHCVLHGPARVIEKTGRDVTCLYRKGALLALSLARNFEIAVAVLADGSPSCGSSFIYNGEFSGEVQAGRGVTAALLEESGIKVFSDSEILQADAYLRSLEEATVPSTIRAHEDYSLASIQRLEHGK